MPLQPLFNVTMGEFLNAECEMPRDDLFLFVKRFTFKCINNINARVVRGMSFSFLSFRTRQHVDILSVNSYGPYN